MLCHDLAREDHKHHNYSIVIDEFIKAEDTDNAICYYNSWISEADLTTEYLIFMTRKSIVDCPDCGLIPQSDLPEEEVPCSLCKNKVKLSEPVCWWCNTPTNKSELNPKRSIK